MSFNNSGGSGPVHGCKPYRSRKSSIHNTNLEDSWRNGNYSRIMFFHAAEGGLRAFALRGLSSNLLSS